MGNAQLKVGGDSNDDLLITTSLLQNFKKHVTSVDHAVIGLVRGIDALQSTCQLFLQQKEKHTAEEHKATIASEETEVLIIQKIHECISDNRDITLESLRNIFSFFKDVGQPYIVNADDAFASLSVNRYKPGHSDKITHHDWFTEFYKRRLEQLKADIELLHKSDALQKKEIEALKKQCVLFRNRDLCPKEIEDGSDWSNRHKEMLPICKREYKHETLVTSTAEPTCIQPIQTPRQNQYSDKEDEVEELGKNDTTRNMRKKSTECIPNCQTMQEQTIDDLQKHISSLENKLSNMETELLKKETIISQLGKKKLLVQIFRQPSVTFQTANDAEEDLLHLLKSHFLQRDEELDFIRCGRLSNINDKLPILIMISHVYFNTRNSVVGEAMKGIEIADNRAVVVFHSKAEKDMPHELEQYDKVFPLLGGVFHFGHKSFLHNSPMNKENMENVIAFIEKFGEVKKFRIHTDV